MFVWILACQVLFILIQEGFGEKVVDSIQGQLRQELAISNFNFLARSITDFTTSGAIECGVLDKITPIKQRIIDLRYMSQGCSVNKWTLDGSFIEVSLKSLNGDLYQFNFISKNPSLFYFALWGFRILGLIAILGISFAVRAISRSELEIAQRMKKLAIQVSHDIRSPLSALMMTLKGKEFETPEEKFVVMASLERINDIANNLLQSEKKNGENQPRLKTGLIIPMINSVLSEKRYQFQEIEDLKFTVSFDVDHFICTSLDESIFKRALSNILNNSVEAIKDNPEIIISLSAQGDSLCLSIKDFGVGIPQEHIDKIFHHGYSLKKHSKESGTGIGLSYAKEAVHSFGGSLNINSVAGEGTEIIIQLPIASSPEWLVKEINLRKYEEVWVLDDDPSIHFVWKKKLDRDIRVFSNIESFKQELRQSKELNRLYLIDFELGAEQTGLELIEELQIMNSSILVTSVFNSRDIQEKVLMHKMGVVPKFLIEKLEVIKTKSHFDFVYIDDDSILRMGWENKALKKGINLLTLASINEFYKYTDLISKEKTQIYIDSNLGKDSIPGEEFAKTLYKEGYRKLNLATGYDKGSFQTPSWLNIEGKACPF